MKKHTKHRTRLTQKQESKTNKECKNIKGERERERERERESD